MYLFLYLFIRNICICLIDMNLPNNVKYKNKIMTSITLYYILYLFIIP